MKNLSLTFLALITHSSTSSTVHAELLEHRLSIGVGLVHLSNPSETDFEIGAEYEYHFQPLFGVGALGNYVFSDPSVALLGAPVFYFHPLAGDWWLSASPIVQFGSGRTTQVGARVGTRVPVPLGVVTLVPSLAVDFIGGGRNYIFGLGIQI